ncbi:unnamed protein product [Heligmosomoides polygyrus]|uniref:Reverse transcriptase domain-containing protein n=1 Tax=Heligmosomoides polygyrus TaxID=6339 RepID=A0A183GA84_HELPZ|nr:unnamed protein product [Heligmosomoides polygyrus]
MKNVRIGSPADCASYRPIRLVSHTMKIFERIVDRRIRDVVQLSTNQCGSVAGCGTVDAIHAVRLLLEKHRENQKPVHFAFLDLEVFDRVPREVMWCAFRRHGVPEELIEWVRILYSCPVSRVRALTGTSMEFPVSVGMYQASALSPLLFVVVMDATISKGQLLGRCFMLMTSYLRVRRKPNSSDRHRRGAIAWHCSASG